ncbi:hypothetical protein YC2023_057083 [Brassica napus]
MVLIFYYSYPYGNEELAICEEIYQEPVTSEIGKKNFKLTHIESHYLITKRWPIGSNYILVNGTAFVVRFLPSPLDGTDIQAETDKASKKNKLGMELNRMNKHNETRKSNIYDEDLSYLTSFYLLTKMAVGLPGDGGFCVRSEAYGPALATSLGSLAE